ncbi:hypothetical protein J1TS5_61570 [Paenibacillus macerans]|uniref:hypothetical protein n=1 Tax=Paenibacillus macerans TaxID=44252 RepID=UPI001B1A67DE|nr:hypothetical protein [Paenibacillus macerans]GIP13987.1 hypothetical protein J1TS5_61570 [Paenibacillus macerans]
MKLARNCAGFFLFIKGVIFIKITDEEIAAAERAVPILRLLEQTVTYCRPGNYRFRAAFPKEYGTWTEIATTLRQSPVEEVRDYGRSMADVVRCLNEVDEAVAGGNARQVRRKIAAHIRSWKALSRRWEAFGARMIAEELAKDGN